MVCLFCEDSHETVEHLLAHFNEAHKFDFLEYIRENKLSMYDRLKLLVHLRKEVSAGTACVYAVADPRRPLDYD